LLLVKGKPFVLPCVRTAEQEIINAKLDHEYVGMSGIPEGRNFLEEYSFAEFARYTFRQPRFYQMLL
jgi:aspartate/tyrosine/aromatic aminotransferase